MTTPTPPLSKKQAWGLAIRPKTLPAAIAAVCVGIALTLHDGQFHLLAALAALLTALLLQIASNLANDVFDYERGVDRGERLGPPRVTQSGLLTPAEVRRGLWLTLALTSLPGFYLVWRAGWPALWIGLAAVVALLAYTGGPFPYGSYALGDFFVFLFFGLVAVAGTYFVQTPGDRTLQAFLQLPAYVWLSGAAIGLLITNILIVNNYRDIPTDRRNGKKTLAVLLGERGARLEYLLFLGAAFLLPLYLAARHTLYGTLLTWLLLPAARRRYHQLGSLQGQALNALLAQTASFAFYYALLFSLGILISP